MTKTLAQIDAGHFCAGFMMRDDKVIEAAPILKYMVGWPRDKVRQYCKVKKWAVEIVGEIKDDQKARR